MDKNVIIHLRGVQAYEDMTTSDLELITEGKYACEDGVYNITYKESEVTGMEGTTTILRVEGDEVSLLRHGSVNSHFIFKKGYKKLSYYDTAFGAFTISIFTKNMNINIDDNGGEIQLGYEMEIDNNKTGLNNFHMLIKPAEGS
ncbi:MAG: DUF1934 domain-containing protein [Clostridiales bacterium]|nr:DUF1934 domain-containing protein [Clostridiales bacterium]